MADDAETVLRVLCVDDNRDMADSIVALFMIAGCQARACYDGLSALAVAEAFQPEACVLDLNMPGMGGDELARLIRAGPSGARTVLVALTGLPEDESRTRTATAGFDLILSKPIDHERLANLLIDIVILRVPPSAHRLPALPPP